MTHRLSAGLILCLAALAARPALAQDDIKISGLAYVDYAYVLASPTDGQKGDNGFGYRRLYLTTDYKLSDTFSGRARLEANDGSTTAQGRPAPFVKDLYLTWKNVWGEGHDLVAGISSPPSFTVAEKVWGYRSLEKTIMDRNKIVSSRDFGVAAKGRLGDALRYGLMAANNNGVAGEDDRHKRLYGQLEWHPSEQLALTLGGDYAGYGDERRNGATLNAFAGYTTDAFRLGAEGFFNRIRLDDPPAKALAADADELVGLSLFAAARLADAWEAVARFDQVERDLAGAASRESFFLAGLAYQPHPQVRVIPNVLVSKDSRDADALVTGRLTLDLSF